MPVRGIKEYNWKQTQLSNGPKGLNAKIKKEVEVSEEGTVWRDRKARLAGCIATKKEHFNS
jgi:hypothetical protein